MLPFLTQKMLSDSVEDKNSSTLGKSLKKERKNVKTILFFCAFLKFIATNLQLVISLHIIAVKIDIFMELTIAHFIKHYREPVHL